MNRHSGSRSRWEYVDFHLEIRAGGPHKYPVVVRSPEGEVQEEVSFPFDIGGWELKYKLKAMEQAVGRSGETRRRIGSQEERIVQDFGQALFKALLRGEVGAHYKSTFRAAKRENKRLRLKLHIHPSELAVLPWEFLYDPGRDEYLCLSPDTPLVRYLDLDQPIKRLPVTPPLRILGMVASPLDLPELDVDDEQRRVDEAIEVLRKDRLVELIWLEGQTWSDLQEAMWWGDSWHIFHFIGHGDFDPISGEGRIALSDEAGRQDLQGARNLARLLDSHDHLRLVYLNSCQGAQSSEGDAFSSTAATLVRRGVPAVLAMQYEITDKAAIAFARVFYRAVANSLPVDAAVAAGRTAVSMGDTLEWVTPVLHMRSPDGRIFDIPTEAQPGKSPEERENPEEEGLLRHPLEPQERAASEKPGSKQSTGPYEEATRDREQEELRTHPAVQQSEVCPYRGLDTFTEDDAEFFFGRQRVVKKLLDELRRDPSFLAVLGPSGSGKSSVIQAGLIPQLRRRRVLQTLGVVIVRQYDDPFKQLAAAGLEGASEGLVDAAGTWLEQHPERQRLLLVLDQFEELLISCSEPLRQDFLRQLMELLGSPYPITVVLAMQEGFYSRLELQAPELAEYGLPGSLVEVPSYLEDLNRYELISIVQKPAEVAGLRFEDGLIERIVHDAIEAAPSDGGDRVLRSTVLPLLEYALSRLWEHRQDGMLTPAAYDDIGGLTGG